MSKSIEEYDKMSKEDKVAYDAEQRTREQTEQSTLPYTWTQELKTVSVSVPLPAGTRARDLSVVMDRKRLKAGLKGKEPILEGDLFEEIVVDDSSWTVDNGVLQIELEKLGGHVGTDRWWPHVLTHHPKLDTTKITPENSKLSDLDPETRGMVEKMMFDNRQREAGKPTSDEIRKVETLEKFKKLHPEMDFSEAKME